MTFDFDTSSTKFKANFDNMEKYEEGISEWEKVVIFLEKIFTNNHNLKYEITLFRYNHNGNYLSETNYPATQIITNPMKQLWP